MRLTQKEEMVMSKVFAHRGFSGKYPENTLLAFRKAMEAECDGIELDVHLAKDGSLIIMHDEKLDRTTNGTGLLCEHTLDELRQFDASAVMPGKFPFEPIPTLAEYFELVKDTPVITNIELKNSVIWYEGMEEKVIEMVRAYHLEDRVIFSSFNHESIALCKRLAPEIPCGFLYDCWLIHSGAYAKTNGVEYLHPSLYSLNDTVIDEIAQDGVGLNVWTVNEESGMRYLAQKQVNGIITNHPDVCRAVLRSLS